MNPRIAKELRTQAPVFGLLVACALVTVAASLAQSPYLMFSKITLVVIHTVACLLMAAMTFGNEFHYRTLSLLLSQPVARQSLWPQKMRVLASLCVYSALITIIAKLSGIAPPWDHRNDLLLVSNCCFLVAVPALFCCTTPYYTLLSKSTLGGIVFTLFGSGMMYALSGEVWNQLSVIHGLGDLKDKLTSGQLDGPSFIFVILCVPYCALLYYLGRRRFLRLEVIDSQSLEGNLPQGLETALAGFSARFRSPLSRLLFKELRLQRISLMLTAAFCLFMVFERLTWNPTNERSFIAAGTLCLYILLFPVIVSATAVAEEKTWGMKDWHLTLPPSHKLQWRVKWFVALTLSLVLGAGLTWFVSQSGPWQKDIGVQWESEMLCYPLLIAAALYAGSVSASTIRALMVTFGMAVAFAFIGAALFSMFESFPFYEKLDSIGLYFFAVCVMLAELYSLVLRFFWYALVWPFYLVTHSKEKAGAVARWADPSTNHLQVLFLGLYVAGLFWLLLRFARSNYRQSDLAKRRVACQLFIILLAAIFLIVAMAGARHAWHGIPIL